MPLRLSVSNVRDAQTAKASCGGPVSWGRTRLLGIVMAVPWLSTRLVQPRIDAARAQAVALQIAPRDAWYMECVQQDPLTPKPCTEAERAQYAGPDAGADEDDDALMREMMR